jgi:hypothetical protein
LRAALRPGAKLSVKSFVTGTAAPGALPGVGFE